MSSLKKGVKGIKAGLPREYFVEGLDRGIKESVMEAVNLLEKNGMEIEEISLPHSSHAISSYYLVATAEASSQKKSTGSIVTLPCVQMARMESPNKANPIAAIRASQRLALRLWIKRDLQTGPFLAP